MLRIAVCDDEKTFHKVIGTVLDDYLGMRNIEYMLDAFSSGKDLFSDAVDISSYTIIFLDINMEEIDGIRTAVKIREISKSVFIVFVTAFVKYSLEGYKVNAIRYLIKGSKNFDQTVYECMNAILAQIEYDSQLLLFDFKEGKKELHADDIIFVESHLHKVSIHILKGRESVYTQFCTLDSIENRLRGYSFLRIHQSYLVNLKYVKTIRSYRVVMKDGRELPVPRPKFRNVKNAFAEFRGVL